VQTRIAAAEIVSRIQTRLGVTWDATAGDGLQAGRPDTPVTGIATAWTPSLDVLRRAVAVGANLIVTRECAFWSREAEIKGYSGAGATTTRKDMATDPTFAFKRSFIEANNLVLWRLSGNWDARQGDAQLANLVTALGWQTYQTDRPGRFTLPPMSLSALTSRIRTALGARALRVLGDPAAPVRTVALTHGFLLVPEVQRLVHDAQVDVIVGGEPVEWEAFPYVADLVTAGRAKGMILLGHAVSEEPGSDAVANWLKTIVPEVAVRFLPSGEPFWTPALAGTRG
jgi:putative NIF3 family GTP cyclohydrolase 1 type 2